MKMYIYPMGQRRLIGFVAARSDSQAQKFHPEAQEATIEEVAAGLVESRMIPLAGRRKYAEMRHFLGKQA